MKQLSKNLALVVLLLTIGQQAFSYDFKIDGIFYNYNITTVPLKWTNRSLK